MERKYRVLIVGDATNHAGPLESQWAEFTVPEEFTDDRAFSQRVHAAALAAWIGYRERETMAQAVNEATKP